MVEKFIKNPLMLKRWKRFRAKKLAMISLILFSLILAISLTSEIWSNSKPIVLSYQGEIYFPSIEYYHPSVFQEKGSQVNYRNLTQKGTLDWSLWPLNPWDPYESNLNENKYPSPPSRDNVLGTDDRGRDVLSRLIYGFRYSVGFAFALWIFSYILGTFLGAAMGFFAGKVDLFGQRVVEVLESLPILIILLTFVSIFGSSFTVLVILSVILGWMGISLYMRAEFLRLRGREFVEAARALGASSFSIAFRHILPNALSPIITFSPFAIATGISYLTILDYLGFGLPPPTPSWGELLQQAQNYVTEAWWLGVFPAFFLILCILLLNLIGEGIRDSFDSRSLE